MRKFRIAADSAADLMDLPGIDFACAPLTVRTEEREFRDAGPGQTEEMVSYLEAHKGRSQTSCPSPADWLDAFGDADDILCIPITSGLSGSYNAACTARDLALAEDKERRIFVVDSLTAGPEMRLLAEKAAQWAGEGRDFETICRDILSYQKKTGLLFLLQSLKNFAANGRVSPAAAKLAQLFNIRILGQASREGKLELLHKCHGQTRSFEAVLSTLKKAGVERGRLILTHCLNEPGAQALRELLHAAFPQSEITVAPCGGLCSYYAERGGLLVGFEAF